MKNLITIVVPCFNEEPGLPELFKRLGAVVDSIERLPVSYDVEVICVDDGSMDDTWCLLREQASRDQHWKGISLSRNFGHQAAVSAGMYYAKGDCVCIIDADLQDPPKTILEFISEWEIGSEVVYGVRNKRRDRSLKKLLAWGFYRFIGRLVSLSIPLDAGDFCLLDRKVVDLMNKLPEKNRYLRGLRVWCGFKHVPVYFDREVRFAGEPQYTFRKSLKLALDGIYSFSAVPLALASHLGLWISIFAFIGVVFTFLQRVFRDWFSLVGLEPAPGFATLVISILFLGGIQLICLGIIGEYLGRIYDEVKGRPIWVIGDSTFA